MLFEKVKSDLLAHNSYMIGSGSEAAVIDPRRDCRIYTKIAESRNMTITRIFETHRNEDYVVGSRELARPTGAEIYHGAAIDFGYGNAAGEGDTFSIGTLRLRVLETPGHTKESLSYVLSDTAVSDDPLMVFTGDALFAGDVGRTDLAGDEMREKMSGMLYDSLHDKILPLGDDVIVCPAHGAGSVCGGDISDREYTTIGYEKEHTPLLQWSKADFVEYKKHEHLYVPPYFRKMEDLNLHGPPLIYTIPHLAALSPKAIREMQNAQILDIRSPTSFAGGHVPGSINIWREGLPAFIGYLLKYDDPIVLIDDFNLDLDPVIRHFVRLGYDTITGYLAGGFAAWFRQGRELETAGIWSPRDLAEHLTDPSVFILDVRDITHRERDGYIPGSHHIYVGNLDQNLGRVPRDKHIVAHCDVGYKGSLAASILQKNGYENVTNLLGGTHGWEGAGYSLTRD
ncbi:MBL fold metallo-hydrolase [Methanoculleus sp. FWC-SCC1]|uniref:MBL fold metallo-hydrolase n=1 Tax=Methanoculleus frigidifontis TaxID=2584085 RepID=A0ABT8MDC4_9EURY|nr:MBL fold metallo-hydrolase [Methanoculleus sp. FWC-SCC1]MDN7025889.1 MBL fold metallo-hydrolase [Methanoculleus sp. FWC-SCC1]